MVLALGKEGGLGVLPTRLPIEEQASTIRRIKNYEMDFVEDPITARENETINEILRVIDKTLEDMEIIIRQPYTECI